MKDIVGEKEGTRFDEAGPFGFFILTLQRTSCSTTYEPDRGQNATDC